MGLLQSHLPLSTELWPWYFIKLKMRPLILGPLYQDGDSLHVLSQILTWPPRGATPASQFRLEAGDQRMWYLSKGWLAMQPDVNAYRA